MLAEAFAQIGMAFSAALGGPFFAAAVINQADTVYDDGGSIISTGDTVSRACQAQIDSATEAMRGAEGFVDTDVRFIVLAATLTGSLGTDAIVEVLAGPHAGLWSVSSIERDPVAAGWVGVGRRA